MEQPTVMIAVYVDRTKIAAFADFSEARDYAENHFDIMFCEPDKDFADCWDAITTLGNIITVQPE